LVPSLSYFNAKEFHLIFISDEFHYLDSEFGFTMQSIIGKDPISN